MHITTAEHEALKRSDVHYNTFCSFWEKSFVICPFVKFVALEIYVSKVPCMNAMF